MSENLTDLLTSIRPADYVEHPSPCSWEEFQKVIQARRSVRVYDGTPVPETVIQNAIDAAILAPNSSNLQQVEFYWVTSPEKKAKLVASCLSQPAAKTAAELMVVVSRLDTWKRNAEAIVEQLKQSQAPAAALSYYQKLVPLAYENGPLGFGGLAKRVFFAMRGLSRATPREPKSYADLRVWSHKSAALAAENFMLAISAQGFDSCPMEGMDSQRVRKLLGLGCGAEICMVISVGKRGNGGVYGPRARLSRDWFVFKV